MASVDQARRAKEMLNGQIHENCHAILSVKNQDMIIVMSMSSSRSSSSSSSSIIACCIISFIVSIVIIMIIMSKENTGESRVVLDLRVRFWFVAIDTCVYMLHTYDY